MSFQGNSFTGKFGGNLGPKLRLLQGIPVLVEKDAFNHTIVWWEEAEEFGYGDSVDEAMDDFGRSVVELYFTLNGGDRLGPGLTRIKSVVAQYIVPRTAKP
jgi:hypothetical protein